jgi:hypothetical protein
MADSQFTPEEQAEIRRLARSAAASVLGRAWDDEKDQSRGDSNRDDYIARTMASHHP